MNKRSSGFTGGENQSMDARFLCTTEKNCTGLTSHGTS